ncbi:MULTISPECIES: hypothetical protein [unclassified Acinetobacter]|uniref:hypothetical protein n=1 Tax=unclassified Acinetobacter TaxID=196816 RepID=UPI0035B7B023
MHFECQDKYGAIFSVTADELEGNFTATSYDYPTPVDGKEMYSTFSVSEEGELKHFSFNAYNQQNAHLAGMRVDFPLTFVDMRGDGLSDEDSDKNLIYGVSDEDDEEIDIFDERGNKLQPNDSVKVGSKIQLDIGYECVAEYGGRIQIFDLVGEDDDREINQEIYDSVWLKKEYFDESNWAEIMTFEFDKPRKITGFGLYLFNISGELLDHEIIEFPLNVVD